jgi:4-hydroxybenzoate polyprenyltransferase
MRRSLLPFLKLIRLPNVVTAAADSLAGWLLVGGALGAVGGWLPLAVASMLLYAAGMALNDAFDLEIDRVERPARPIPSGQVSRGFAIRVGAGGLVLGPLVAWASGSVAALIVAVLLAGAILAYDAGIKRSVLGPEIMGLCRGLNLLLGMTHAPALGGTVAWLAAAAYGLFVAGITWISRSETVSGQTRNLLLGLGLQNAAIVGLLAVGLQPGSFPEPVVGRPLIPLEGLLVLVLVALVVNVAASRAIHDPVPRVIQSVVKTGILSLVWIDVGLVAAVRGPWPAAAVASLWIPAFVLGRWLYST